MKTLDLEERKELILARETAMARQLALHVIERPVPRVWMIFIPIFFVFYFWKLKQYESGLKDFAENHLIPRRRVLEAVCAAEESGRPLDVDLLVNQMGAMQENTRSLCTEWLTTLAGHFWQLFAAGGDSYPELVRSAYRHKANLLLFCHRLGQTEKAFDEALLPSIEGDNAQLCLVTKTMTEGMRALRSREADEIFS